MSIDHRHLWRTHSKQGNKINTKNGNSRNFPEIKKKKDVKFHIERTHNIAERIYSEKSAPRYCCTLKKRENKPPMNI